MVFRRKEIGFEKQYFIIKPAKLCTGIQNHPNLAPPLKDKNGNPIRYNFTDSEKSALVAFLNTLTDEKYSNPFK